MAIDNQSDAEALGSRNGNGGLNSGQPIPAGMAINVVERPKKDAPEPSNLTRGKTLLRLAQPGPTSFLPLFVIFLTFLAYSAAPRFGFVFDDKTVVVENPFIRSWNLVPHFFTTNVLTFDPTGAVLNYYRPGFLL
ncbi:MAG: hypothetical protein DMG21_04330 [Acidobacteria bacterium]|nr:MAG: hypothetical protein DMG21_04330 [Acidobacteriota bacterium]